MYDELMKRDEGASRLGFDGPSHILASTHRRSLMGGERREPTSSDVQRVGLGGPRARR